jgi:putative ABC transport system permease protein
MRTLFGVPVGTLTAVLGIALIVALSVVGVLALRNRIFFKLGVRNLSRRRGRTAVIVLGLMLGTAIVAAALGTGDTMAYTVRSSALSALGSTDEVVSARSADTTSIPTVGQATGVRYLTPAEVSAVLAAAHRSALVDGAAPAIVEPIAVQDRTSRQNEPRVTLFAPDPARLAGFGAIHDTSGRVVSLGALRPGEVYLNEKSATSLDAHVGDRLVVLSAGRSNPVVVRRIVAYDGAGTDGQALLMPLGAAQRLLGVGNNVQEVLISNQGGPITGATHTAAVRHQLAPVVRPLGLQTHPVKQDGLDLADKQGASFLSLFTTFGTFTIAAGVLLIFLIFVMLAAERRSEMGTARAVGTQRKHLVEMFLFEGMAYDVLAAAVGAVLGLALALVMVRVIASAVSSTGVTIRYSIRGGSLALAYAIGVVLTLTVVTISASRVSRLNITSAIRNLPEPPKPRPRRRRAALAIAAVVVGILMVTSGTSSNNATAFITGVALLIMAAVPILRAVGISDRVAYSIAGVALMVWCLLPFSVYRAMLPGLKMDFSVWVVVGLLLVVGATWVVMYNTNAILGALNWAFGRIPSLAPVLKTATAQPLRARFRTGTTIALFTLVVFTLVVGATTSGAFLDASNDQQAFNGGFDIRAETAPLSPVTDMASALKNAPGIRASDLTGVASQSFIPVEARQGSTGTYQTYPVRGVDTTFARTTSYGFSTMARGYHTSRQVWNALATQPGLAVVDPFVVPRRNNWNFNVLPKFRLHGFYVEDKSFTPVPVELQDPQTGTLTRITIIGVLKDTIPLDMAGIATSQQTLARFGAQTAPSVWYFRTRPGINPAQEAKRLESAFLANGMQAKALSTLLHDAVSASLTFQWLILGFLGLGLLVGVAALGVISARAVAERRQQIGILRAIGFQRHMVRLSFLIESTFIAVIGIATGTILGLLVAYNVISDAANQPSWSNITFSPPWLSLAAIFALVFLASLLTTYWPARRASRVYPATALRYQ